MSSSTTGKRSHAETTANDDDDDEEYMTFFDGLEDEDFNAVDGDIYNAPNDPITSHSAVPIALVNICNYVVTCELNGPTLFTDILRYERKLGVSTNRKKFRAALVITCIEPQCTLLLSQRGRIVCSGCDSSDEVVFAIDAIIRRLRTMTKRYRNLDRGPVRLCNYVGKILIPHNIDTARICKDLAAADASSAVRLSTTEVLNEGVALSPGIRKITVLVYPSGYVVITGANSKTLIAQALARVIPFLERYYCGSVMQTFSMDRRQRYITELTDITSGVVARSRLLVVLNDGSIGTYEQWHEYTNPEETISRALQTLTGDAAISHSTRIQLLEPAPKEAQPPKSSLVFIEDKAPQSTALVTTTSMLTKYEERVNEQHHALERLAPTHASARTELANIHNDVMYARALERETELKRMHTDIVLREGPQSIAKASRPKRTKVVPVDKARDLFSGIEDE